MDTLKSIIIATFGIVLAIVMLPVFVWLGLAALGASVVAIIAGTAVTAWQMRKLNKDALQD